MAWDDNLRVGSPVIISAAELLRDLQQGAKPAKGPGPPGVQPLDLNRQFETPRVRIGFEHPQAFARVFFQSNEQADYEEAESIDSILGNKSRAGSPEMCLYPFEAGEFPYVVLVAAKDRKTGLWKTFEWEGTAVVRALDLTAHHPVILFEAASIGDPNTDVRMKSLVMGTPPKLKAGCTFKLSITAGAGVEPRGEVCLTQLVQSMWVRKPGAKGGVVLDETERWCLDGHIGYGGRKEIRPNQTVELGFDDSPYLVIKDGSKELGVYNLFRVHAMYRPDKPRAVWISIGSIQWKWAGEASLAVGPDGQGDWVVTRDDPGRDPVFTASLKQPTWPIRIQRSVLNGIAEEKKAGEKSDASDRKDPP
jgi:hypothetical protein